MAGADSKSADMRREAGIQGVTVLGWEPVAEMLLETGSLAAVREADRPETAGLRIIAMTGTPGPRVGRTDSRVAT